MGTAKLISACIPWTVLRQAQEPSFDKSARPKSFGRGSGSMVPNITVDRGSDSYTRFRFHSRLSCSVRTKGVLLHGSLFTVGPTFTEDRGSDGYTRFRFHSHSLFTVGPTVIRPPNVCRCMILRKPSKQSDCECFGSNYS